jgi:hypothetical protein
MDEDRLIYLLLVAVTAPVVIAAIVRGGDIGPGQTLAGLLAILGVVGLLRSSPRELIPRASWRKRQ